MTDWDHRYAWAASVREAEQAEATIRAEAERLTAEWNAALAEYRRTDSARDFEAEQKAYDALVDFVEANGLNYSEYDPRGPEEAQSPCGCYADDPGCPPEHRAFNER
jgi:hypothetical protein